METQVKFLTSQNETLTGTDGEPYANISLNCVYDADPNSENARFFKATPSGSCSLSVVNPDGAAVSGQSGDEILATFRNLSAEKRAQAPDPETTEEAAPETTEEAAPETTEEAAPETEQDNADKAE